MTSIQYIIGPHVRDFGGFSVKRVLPSVARQTAGSFIFLGHMGSMNFAPGEGIDMRPHPHIGLATVTHPFDGNMVYRDSLGSMQTIIPGDMNQMTADSGIIRSERSSPEEREKGARMHGIQTWVALSKDQEKVNTSFAYHAAETLPKLGCPGVQGVIIAGDAFGPASPVKVDSCALCVALELATGTSLVIPPEHADRGLYLVDGTVTIDGEALDLQHLAVLEPGGDVTFTAQAPSHIMLLDDAPTDGHRYIYWNSVASDKTDIEDAKQCWESNAFAHVPDETERVPLPSK